jgi:phospholipase/carboxylesterase
VIEAGCARGGAELAGVLLHGRGETPDAMIALARRMDVDGCRWIAPTAPAGSWYPHRFLAAVEANEPFLSNAIDLCDRAVSEAGEGGRLPTVLVGFSQGACLASEYVLRRPGRCGAVVMFTGGLIGADGTTWRLTPPATTLGGLPVLVTGSEADEWVPAARVRETARVLSQLGARVRLRIVARSDHMVSDAEVEDARAFISRAMRVKLTT